MDSYSLKKDSGYKDVEKSISIISENPNVRLRLPNTLKERGVFGIEGLVLLLIGTWLRNGEGRIIHTYCRSEDFGSFDDFGSSLYGICAMRLADELLEDNGNVIDSKKALRSAFESVKKILSGDYKNAYKGLYLAVPSIKSKGINKEFNNPFYLNKNIIGKKECRDLCRDMIFSVVPQKGRVKVIDDIVFNISDMVWELFDNTHKHGRVDELGNILDINFRGVIFNSVDVTKDRLEHLSKSGVPGMSGFVMDWLNWIQAHNKKLPVLDITVVDAGPGYARRWSGLSKEVITYNQEVDAILNCFKKNSTSTGNNADGSGLTHVLTDLRSVSGWFRLRTGSVSVSKSFFMDTEGDIAISKKNISKCNNFVEGNSFNIVIPLVDLSREVV